MKCAVCLLSLHEHTTSQRARDNVGHAEHVWVKALQRYYFYKVPAQEARDQYNLISWPGPEEHILLSDFWCGLQRLQPCSASGTQALRTIVSHPLFFVMVSHVVAHVCASARAEEQTRAAGNGNRPGGGILASSHIESINSHDAAAYVEVRGEIGNIPGIKGR